MRRPPAILAEGGVCDPLKGWARRDTALPDTFGIEQAIVDCAGLGLQLIQMLQASLADQVPWLLMTVSIRRARPSLRYCLTRGFLESAFQGDADGIAGSGPCLKWSDGWPS